MRCAICDCEIKDYGNNPYPTRLDKNDRCCDECNSKYVVPARIILKRTRPELKNELAYYLDDLNELGLDNFLKAFNR